MSAFVDFFVTSVKRADYFGETIKLQFDKNKKFNTMLGGLLSLIIYALSLALIISLGTTLIVRNIPRTNSVDLFVEYAPKLNIKTMDLNFAFGFFLDGKGRYDDPTYFNYKVLFPVVDRSSGAYKKTNYAVDFDYCKNFPERFVSSKYNYTEQAALNEIDGLYCFTYNNHTLEGAYVLDYFANLKIEVSRCKNSTKSKVICKSDSEINNALTGGTFQVFYTNRYMDVTDFQNPMKEYLPNWFIKIDPLSSRFVDLYFKTINITSDVGYIFEDLQTESYALYDYAREQFDTKSSESTIIKLYINSSSNFQVVSRSYMKFTDLAATVGGILNVCLVIGQVIARYFSETQIKLKMINSLFYFDTNDDDAMSAIIENVSTINIKETKTTEGVIAVGTLTEKRQSYLKNTVQKTILDNNIDIIGFDKPNKIQVISKFDTNEKGI